MANSLPWQLWQFGNLKHKFILEERQFLGEGLQIDHWKLQQFGHVKDAYILQKFHNSLKSTILGDA